MAFLLRSRLSSLAAPPSCAGARERAGGAQGSLWPQGSRGIPLGRTDRGGHCASPGVEHSVPGAGWPQGQSVAQCSKAPKSSLDFFLS